MPWARCRASMSSSWNDPSSSRYSIRSRAVILPLAWCLATAASLPAWRASSLRAASSFRRSAIECSMGSRLPERGEGPGGDPLLLDQLDQGAERRLRVNEGHGRAARPGPGDLVDHAPAGVLDRLQGDRAVRHPVADVVQPL